MEHKYIGILNVKLDVGDIFYAEQIFTRKEFNNVLTSRHFLLLLLQLSCLLIFLLFLILIFHLLI
jgi:hypothetical protein